MQSLGEKRPYYYCANSAFLKYFVAALLIRHNYLTRLCSSWWVTAVLSLMLGCASNSTMRGAPVTTPVSGGASASVDGHASTVPDARLAALWGERSAPVIASDDDYPIGPGDVLTVSVPEMPELSERKVRVSVIGQIELPLIGKVQAGGLTEDALAKELDRKLEKYMLSPEASVFVDEYRNREVAVVGAVSKPGLVVLNSPGETIMDVLTQSGGLMPSAADELVLIPANEKNQAGKTPVPMDSDAAQAMALADSPQAVSIKLHSTSLTGGGNYLNLPVRPGDVIVVPGGGQVMVVGWVQRPGHFDVGSGLTVLGAIGEAGGPMYAAETKSITLIRNGKNGIKASQSVNLDKIMQGKESDVPVEANDVIDVPYSNWRIGPFVFYSVVSKIGVAAPMIPY